jgi:hypothetical protein
LDTEATQVPRATHVQLETEQFIVLLADKQEISVPWTWFPRLQAGTTAQRTQWRLIGEGVGIHWEALDEDVSIAGLLGLSD